MLNEVSQFLPHFGKSVRFWLQLTLLVLIVSQQQNPSPGMISALYRFWNWCSSTVKSHWELASWTCSLIIKLCVCVCECVCAVPDGKNALFYTVLTNLSLMQLSVCFGFVKIKKHINIQLIYLRLGVVVSWHVPGKDAYWSLFLESNLWHNEDTFNVLLL